MYISGYFRGLSIIRQCISCYPVILLTYLICTCETRHNLIIREQSDKNFKLQNIKKNIIFHIWGVLGGGGLLRTQGYQIFTEQTNVYQQNNHHFFHIYTVKPSRETAMRGQRVIWGHFLRTVSYLPHVKEKVMRGHLSCGDTFPHILRCPLKTGFTV